MSSTEVIREDAESAIRSRLRRSKKIGRVLATISVAAGISWGLANENDTAQIIAGEGVVVAGMGATLLERRSTRRHCEATIDGYRRAYAAGSPSDETKEPESGNTNRALKSFDKLAGVTMAVMTPLWATYGTAVVTDSIKYDGPVMPQGLFAPDVATFNPGLALGALMMVEGVASFNAGWYNDSEQRYIEQLNAINRTGNAADQAVA